MDLAKLCNRGEVVVMMNEGKGKRRPAPVPGTSHTFFNRRYPRIGVQDAG